MGGGKIYNDKIPKSTTADGKVIPSGMTEFEYQSIFNPGFLWNNQNNDSSTLTASTNKYDGLLTTFNDRPIYSLNNNVKTYQKLASVDNKISYQPTEILLPAETIFIITQFLYQSSLDEYYVRIQVLPEKMAGSKVLDFYKGKPLEYIILYSFSGDDISQLMKEVVVEPPIRYERVLELVKPSLHSQRLKVLNYMRGFNTNEEELFRENESLQKKIKRLLSIKEQVEAIALWQQYTLQDKLNFLDISWNEAYLHFKDYDDIREMVVKSSLDDFEPSDWKRTFVRICDNSSIQTAVSDLELDSSTKEEWLNSEGVKKGSGKETPAYDDFTESRQISFSADQEKTVRDSGATIYKAYMAWKHYKEEPPEGITGMNLIDFMKHKEDVLFEALKPYGFTDRTRPIGNFLGRPKGVTQFENYLETNFQNSYSARFRKEALRIAFLMLDLSEKRMFANDIYSDTKINKLRTVFKAVWIKHQDSESARTELSLKYPVFTDPKLDMNLAKKYVYHGHIDAFRNFLEGFAHTKHENIRKSRQILRDKPDKVWELSPLIDFTKEELSIPGESLYAELIEKQIEDHETQELIRNLLLGAMGITLGILSGGSGAPAVTAIILGSYITVTDTLATVEEYDNEKALGDTDFAEANKLSDGDPSIFWVAIALIGLGFELKGMTKDIRKAIMKNIRKKLRQGFKNKADLEKLKEAVEETPGLSKETKEQVKETLSEKAEKELEKTDDVNSKNANLDGILFSKKIIGISGKLETFKASSLRVSQTLETNAEMKVLKKLKQSIEKDGFKYDLAFDDQMQVFQQDGINYLVNGHHRFAVAQRLGIEEVKAVIIDSFYLLKKYGVTPEQLIQMSEQANKIGNKIRWYN